MKIALGCDELAFTLKEIIKQYLQEQNDVEIEEIKDCGVNEGETIDYPDIAEKVAVSIMNGECERGILICNNGIGMSMAANKVKGIRAALCYTAFNARRTRQHNDANILCLGAGEEQVQEPVAEIVNAFLATEFEGGRHRRRVDKIKAMEC